MKSEKEGEGYRKNEKRDVEEYEKKQRKKK